MSIEKFYTELCLAYGVESLSQEQIDTLILLTIRNLCQSDNFIHVSFIHTL